jgi:hypothetical protein
LDKVLVGELLLAFWIPAGRVEIDKDIEAQGNK